MTAFRQTQGERDVSPETALLSRRYEPSRHEIEACEDEAQLATWYVEAVERHAELTAFADGFRAVGLAGEDWLQRVGGKLGYVKLSERWIECRMLVLGFRPPYSPKDPRSRTIRALEDKNKRLAGALRRAGLPVPTSAEVGGAEVRG